MVAKNINSFGNIIVKKLIAEIAQAVPQQRWKLTRPPIEVVRDAAFPSNAAQGAAMLVVSVNKLGFVDDVRSTICCGQRFFTLNVICLFLPAGWAKRRQSFGKRFVRGSTTLFARCVDKLIDQPGVEDHKFLFVPILTVDSQANEIPTF
jgi:hypothetical protein